MGHEVIFSAAREFFFDVLVELSGENFEPDTAVGWAQTRGVAFQSFLFANGFEGGHVPSFCEDSVDENDGRLVGGASWFRGGAAVTEKEGEGDEEEEPQEKIPKFGVASRG